MSDESTNSTHETLVPSLQSYLIVYYILYFIKILIFLIFFNHIFFPFQAQQLSFTIFCPLEMKRNNKKLFCLSYCTLYISTRNIPKFYFA